MCCDQCDRGYHYFCVGLEAIPAGEGGGGRGVSIPKKQILVAFWYKQATSLPPSLPPSLPLYTVSAKPLVYAVGSDFVLFNCYSEGRKGVGEGEGRSVICFFTPGPWQCKLCTTCASCGSKTPGPDHNHGGIQGRWRHEVGGEWRGSWMERRKERWERRGVGIGGGGDGRRGRGGGGGAGKRRWRWEEGGMGEERGGRKRRRWGVEIGGGEGGRG